MNAWTTLPAEIKNKYWGIFPVPVVDIANALKIKVYETDSFSDLQSGSITFDGSNYAIYVNQFHAPTRKAFSIAHEIGHYLLHREKINEKSELVTNTKTPINGIERSKRVYGSDEEIRNERQANEFAASLLMPEEEFKKSFEAAKDINEVAQEFGVSPSAATVRAHKLLGEFFT